jgi:hypothetical protein
MANGGEVSTPSQVKGLGIVSPVFQALVVSVNSVERIWGLEVLSTVALVLPGTVEPALFRAGAVAPGFGSSMVRPLVPQAVREMASAAMASAAIPLRRALCVQWVDGVLLISIRLRVWGFQWAACGHVSAESIPSIDQGVSLASNGGSCSLKVWEKTSTSRGPPAP